MTCDQCSMMSMTDQGLPREVEHLQDKEEGHHYEPDVNACRERESPLLHQDLYDKSWVADSAVYDHVSAHFRGHVDRVSDLPQLQDAVHVASARYGQHSKP